MTTCPISITRYSNPERPPIALKHPPDLAQRHRERRAPHASIPLGFVVEVIR
jgi:hypothetical protein